MKNEALPTRHLAAVAAACVGLAVAFWYLLPGLLLVAAGAGALSPKLRRKARGLRDRIAYRRLGGR
jgi:hypothetical protein